MNLIQEAVRVLGLAEKIAVLITSLMLAGMVYLFIKDPITALSVSSIVGWTASAFGSTLIAGITWGMAYIIGLIVSILLVTGKRVYRFIKNLYNLVLNN